MTWFAKAAIRVAALLVAASSFTAIAAEVPEQATPPLWVVEHQGRTLYLFGSIHLLPPQTKWRRPEVEKARGASQVFVFEAPLDEGGGAMARFIEKGGRLPEGRTLKDILPAPLHADLAKAAWEVQYPPNLLEPLRPWLAAVYLELYAYIKAGFSSFYGVDHVIEQEVKARGAERLYLETVEGQLSFFSTLDRKTEIAYLKATVEGVLKEPNLPYELVSAWASGRVDRLARLLDEGFASVPQLRSRLLVARNRNWAPRIKAMLASDKTHFVTVGVGHLVGKDSVIAMLRAKGYKISGP